MRKDLAARAVETGSLTQTNIFYGGIALLTGMLFSGINIEALFEIPRLTIGVNKVTKGGATLFYGDLETLFAVGDQGITV